MSCSLSRSSFATGHLRCESNQRAMNRHTRRVRAVLAKYVCDFLMAHAPFATRDDRALVVLAKPGERGFVALHAFFTDGLLERRRSIPEGEW